VVSDLILAVMSGLMGAPMAVEIDARLAELGRDLVDDDLEPFTRFLYDSAAFMPRPGTSWRRWSAWRHLARSMGEFLTTYDLLLTPTLPQPTPPLGYLDTTNIEAMFERAATSSALTSPFNITGQPAVSLPLTTGSNGMPIGVQLAAAFGREDRLFSVSAQVEAAHPWSIAYLCGRPDLRRVAVLCRVARPPNDARGLTGRRCRQSTQSTQGGSCVSWEYNRHDGC
jgi:amidase